jgi:hypothetical protein
VRVAAGVVCTSGEHKDKQEQELDSEVPFHAYHPL